MPNLLGVTNPVPNYDNTINNRPLPGAQRPDNSLVQNVADPNRVVRPDNRAEQQDAGNALNSGSLRYDSNLQVFLQQLREMPELTAELSKAVTLFQTMVSAPGLDAGVAQELASLLQMFRMDAEEFRSFFLAQVRSGNRFGGPLFALLRQAYQRSGSEGVRDAILAFAKRYSDFSSTEHIGRHMLDMLRQISDRLPESWKGQLSEMIGQLKNGLAAGDRAGNLQLLQGGILPYLGSYISRFHDLGSVRTFLSMLMLDVTRYENGSEEGLMMSFRQLGACGDTLAGLSQLDDEAAIRLLEDNSFIKAAESNRFAQQLAQTASRALRGELGTDMREAFQEIVRAMLVNESVFMPLNHLMMPLEYEGKKMYSEFWVDPDAEEKNENGQQGERKIQFLFKLDVESLGFVEMTLAAAKGRVDLDVYGPSGVTDHSSVIAEDLLEILKSHGLPGRNVRVLEEKRPLTLTEVFPDLFEGKRSINVKI